MSYFTINLTDLDLDQKKVHALNEQLRKVTVDFLKGFPEGKKYLENSVEFKPDPNGPTPWPDPWPWPIPIPRPIPRPPFPGFFPVHKDVLKAYQKQFNKII